MQIKLSCADVIFAAQAALQWIDGYVEREKEDFIEARMREEAVRRRFFGLLPPKPISRQEAEAEWHQDLGYGHNQQLWAEISQRRWRSEVNVILRAARRAEGGYIILDGDEFSSIRRFMPAPAK